MDTIYSLTPTEQIIMECFWEKGKGLTIKEILAYLKANHQKDWKKQTISTYIAGLQKAGLLRTDASHRPYIYHATCTKDEFIHGKTRKLVAEEYGNSLGRFVAAFVGNARLSSKEAQELREMVDQLFSDDENFSQ